MNSNLTSTLLQSGSTIKKLKTPKKPAYFNSLINGFNAKLQGDITKVEGLDEADKDNPQTVSIDTLLKTVLFDIQAYALLIQFQQYINQKVSLLFI